LPPHIEQMQTHGFQICVIDPEGDYQGWMGTISLGDANRARLEQEAFDVLPSHPLVWSRISWRRAGGPTGFFSKLLCRLGELRSQLGSRNWIVIDEAHHLLHRRVGVAHLSPFPASFPEPSSSRRSRERLAMASAQCDKHDCRRRARGGAGDCLLLQDAGFGAANHASAARATTKCFSGNAPTIILPKIGKSRRTIQRASSSRAKILQRDARRG